MKRDTGLRDRVIVKDSAAIKRAMRRRGFTYRYVAFQIGVSPATVSRIANEDGRPVNERAAQKLLRLLDRDFEDLFDEGVFHVTRDYARRNRAA